MKITRNNMKALIVGLVCLSLWISRPVFGDQLFAPDYIWQRGIDSKTDPVEIADTHLGISYRDDGAIDSRGHFTTFDRPDRFYETPGLNCSGLVVSASRFVFDKNFTLEDVTRDRLGNSGNNSSMGKDWDFGWDLILNLTDGRQRKVVMPDGRDYALDGADGMTLRGFDMHDTAAWQRVLSQMRPGRIYLGSISRPGNERPYKVLHYHVVMMLPDQKGGVWLYHATRRSNVHKMNINSPQGLNRFMSQFRGSREDTKKILVLESVLPRIGEEMVADAGGPPTPQFAAQQQPGASEPAPQESTSQQTGGPETSEEMESQAEKPVTQQEKGPELVINHLSGKAYKTFPDVNASIPRFSDETKTELAFRFQNQGDNPRQVQIILKAPEGSFQYQGQIPTGVDEFAVTYPRDFGKASSGLLRTGEYLMDVRLDGAQWLANLFDVALPREAEPKLVSVKVPNTVEAGKPFTVRIDAQNMGAESDYGGITVSCPNPSGLKIVSAKPGKVYGPGSTVLSVMSDKIRTKVPMAERWIELWGEKKAYDMTVQLQAGQPGTYPLYVRCALRGVNVKSSVILMDPRTSEKADQQGFPVKVYNITVR
ncbi:MAG: hypothetical protein HY912_01055 [Desulfomonile tiedjei]|uniref:Uncharacterized protein n=1 Tax=Desulfomonile tiedjei TaxID=2358 RepID=A0A9D6Z4B9_9BACT|nr:hypothetical protein [Desulfomonile tiedjei]